MHFCNYISDIKPHSLLSDCHIDQCEFNWSLCTRRAGCCESAAQASAALLHPDPSALLLSAPPHVGLPAQGLLVLPALDAVHLAGVAPHPRRRPARSLGVSVWKHGTHLLLAVRHHHSHSPSPVLGAHVSDRHQRHDLHQTRRRHRRLKHWLDYGLFIYSIMNLFPSKHLALEIFPLALLCLIAIPT